jgi:hypothetical protein
MEVLDLLKRRLEEAEDEVPPPRRDRGARTRGRSRSGDTPAVAALKQLEADGLARREGQRGATRWFPGSR